MWLPLPSCGGVVAALKICQNLLSNLLVFSFLGSLRSKSGKIFFIIFFLFIGVCFFFAVAATSCGRGWGGAALKIWQKSFLKSSYSCYGVSFFLGLPLLRAAEGVATLKIWQKSFLKSFFFLSADVSFCGCRYFVRQRGSLRSKSGKNLFYNLFSFYRRFFLFAVAATSCGRGGRCAQNLAKIFFKIFFLNSFLYCLFFWGGGKFFFKIFFYSHFFGRYTFLGRCAQNLAKSTLKSFTYNRRTFSISPLSYRSYHSENKPSGPKLISMPYG